MADPTWNWPTSFDWSVDTWDLAWGVVEGSVNVLPEDSMIAYCKGNATEIYPKALEIYDEFSTLAAWTDDWSDGIKLIQQLIKNAYGT